MRVLSQPRSRHAGSTTSADQPDGQLKPRPSGDLFEELRTRSLTRTEAALYYIDREDPDMQDFLQEMRSSTPAPTTNAPTSSKIRAQTQTQAAKGCALENGCLSRLPLCSSVCVSCTLVNCECNS